MKEIPLYSGSGSKEEPKEEERRNYAAMYPRTVLLIIVGTESICAFWLTQVPEV